MTDRKLFGYNDIIDDFVKGFDALEILAADESVRYLDRVTGYEWLKYVYNNERGKRFNLVRSKPPLTTEQLIEIAFSSIYDDETFAASIRLSIEEGLEKKEYRQQLLSKIQEKTKTSLSHKEKVRIVTIIESSDLRNSTNQRNIVGKHYTEIDKDAELYGEMARQAELIYSKLVSQLNAE